MATLIRLTVPMSQREIVDRAMFLLVDKKFRVKTMGQGIFLAEGSAGGLGPRSVLLVVAEPAPDGFGSDVTVKAIGNSQDIEKAEGFVNSIRGAVLT